MKPGKGGPPPKRPHRAPLPRPRRLDTSWDDVAGWYDELMGEAGNDYSRDIVIPGALRLLDLPAESPVLDIAAGQGAFARAAAERGLRVLGIDASERLVRLAERRSGRRARFLVHDARDLASLREGPFAAAVSLLALQNMDPIEPVLRGAARKLVPGGSFVAVLTHPCFRAARATAWGLDAAGRRFRRVDAYLSPFEEPIVMRPGADPSITTLTFHRPLQHYVRALREAGFLIADLEEWPSHRASTRGSRAKEENRARREIPLFLALRAVRVAGGGTP